LTSWFVSLKYTIIITGKKKEKGMKNKFLKSVKFLCVTALALALLINLGCKKEIEKIRDEIEKKEVIGKFNVVRTQLDTAEWRTVPGDGCLPMIFDYQSFYAEYVYVDNSNPEYSGLVADADSFKSANPYTDSSVVDMDNFSSDYVVQNITVIWSGDSDYDLQVYLNGEVIIQENNCSSGLKIQLDPGYYEIKVWDKSNGSFRNVWINVVGDSELEDHIIHNITYLEKTGSNYALGEHTASYYFQIPSFSTGITAEGGLFVWVGDEAVRLDYGTAFQLIVDNAHADFGKIYYWGGDAWIYSGEEIALNNEFFYKVTFYVSVEDSSASITFAAEEDTFQFDDIFSETEKDESWSAETIARLQAECISKDGMKHIVNVKDFSWDHEGGSGIDFLD
jgi:hypothetical protein